MGFSDAIKTGLAKFVTWQGRASRSEYWYFILFNFLVLFVAAILDKVLGTNFKMTNPATGLEMGLPYGYLYMIAGLALLLPNLAVLVRRLHDTDRSGWWYWIALIPLIGAILLIVWLCTRGTNGSNRYGSDPLGDANVFN